MHSSTSDETDVVVLGGGPAGLAAAIAARQRGFHVVVIDAGRPPIDKACGEGLLPEGVAALHQLGVNLTGADAMIYRGIRFVGSTTSAQADFPAAPGRSLRRTALHMLLVQRAKEAGVCLRWGTQAINLYAHGVLLRGGGVIRSRWIIGADGQNSRCRKWAGLSAARSERLRYGYRRHYRSLAPEYVEIYWGDRAQLFVTPTGAAEVCLAVLSDNPALRLDSALSMFPDVAARLRHAEVLSQERGGVSVSRILMEVQRNNVTLIGDASGSVDAIAGEGMSLAFQQAIALADALEIGNLAHYAAAHQRLARTPRLMARLMLTLGGNAWLRERSLAVFAAEPALFARLLGIHTGAFPLSSFGTSGLLSFTRRFLFAH